MTFLQTVITELKAQDQPITALKLKRRKGKPPAEFKKFMDVFMIKVNAAFKKDLEEFARAPIGN